MMSDLPRWAALISRLKGEEQSSKEELLGDDRKCPENRQNGSDGGKGRGG